MMTDKEIYSLRIGSHYDWKGLSWFSRTLLLSLIQSADKNGVVKASDTAQQEIMQRCGLMKDTIRMAFEELTRLGYIQSNYELQIVGIAMLSARDGQQVLQ